MFVVSSNNTAQPNFRFVFDIYRGATLISRVKLPKRPSSTNCIFDAARIFQGYLSKDLGTPAEAAQQYAGISGGGSPAITQYQIKFGEEYSGTVHADLIRTNNKYTFHGGVLKRDFPDYDFEDFILKKSTANGNFLDNAPPTLKIESNQNAWKYAIVNPSGAASAVGKMQFKKYNTGNGLLGTLNLNAGYAQSYGLFRFATGTTNLNIASTNWIDSSVAKYTFQILDSDDMAVSDLITYQIQDNCRFPAMRLHFLNRLGGIDAFNFTLKNFSNETIERQFFKRRYGTTTSTAWSYDKSERGQEQFDTKIKNGFRLNSDWLTDLESAWLAELIESPQVWSEEGGELFGVTLNINSYEKKTKRNEQLFMIEGLTGEYSFTDVRQRS